MKSLPIAVLIAAALTAKGLWAGEGAPELDYALKDQFGATRIEEDCGEAVTILLGGDRKGSSYIDDWGPELHFAFANELDTGTVCSVGFAHLKGAPFFVKTKIVASFPKDPEEWILLDWKGEIAKKWGAEKDAANLYVFDRHGEFVHHVKLREFDQAVFESIVEVIQMTMAGQ